MPQAPALPPPPPYPVSQAVSSLLASGVSIGQPLIAAEEAASSAEIKNLKVQGGDAFGSTSAAQPLPKGCRAQAVPWVEVQVPFIRADSCAAKGLEPVQDSIAGLCARCPCPLVCTGIESCTPHY